eukprot:TRINITY_DN2833_c0_g1_i1.p1 TRINITY_DN2833_c0_g1~~TRINITY_DN2833_c0_g1_i1.p1  ORF type:complete len:337 (-),score=92.01 TRINITY_DN2833_c0_g1_i1:72-1082(-)
MSRVYHIPQIDPELLTYEFEWPFPVQSSCYLVGSWDNWQNRIPMYRRGRSEPYYCWVNLKEGEYQYKLIVDDAYRCLPFQDIRQNASGHFNNVLQVVDEPFTFKLEEEPISDSEPAEYSIPGLFGEPCYRIGIPITYCSTASSVKIVGSWDRWNEQLPMRKRSNGEFYYQLNLGPGQYAFKFVVDNEYVCREDLPTQNDKKGNVNNVLLVDDDLNCWPDMTPPTDLTPVMMPKSLLGKSTMDTQNITFHYYGPAENVKLSGSFDNWGTNLPMKQLEQNHFEIQMCLPQKEFDFKFLVDGKTWCISEEYEQRFDTMGNVNNHVSLGMSKEVAAGIGF